MRRLLTWLGLAAGALVVFRRFRRRKPEAGAADPAEELRQKLAESRAEEPEPEVAPESEQPAAPVDERRRAVHDKARATIDDMLGGEQLPGEESD
jgi:hypothetical protein